MSTTKPDTQTEINTWVSVVLLPGVLRLPYSKSLIFPLGRSEALTFPALPREPFWLPHSRVQWPCAVVILCKALFIITASVTSTVLGSGSLGWCPCLQPLKRCICQSFSHALCNQEHLRVPTSTRPSPK